ncbi:hypothetical protein I0C86_36165 [Plantactinospora sp. S1510]|uniref:Uncharacterized protein n=1 Tax=Plantactinospora alkalitolerans TaxID=2789879 RepID=A0ABS0H787_9ACTN|nr:hypothetical protein [Plantactinospora alkalitolerans]
MTAVRRVRGSAWPSPPVRLVRLLARLALLGGCALAGYVVLTMLDGPAFADGRTGPDARPGLLASLAGPESPLSRTLSGAHPPSVPEAPPLRDRPAARSERSSNGSDRTARPRSTRDRTVSSEVGRTRTAPSRVEPARSTSDRQAEHRRTPVRSNPARTGADRTGADRIPVVVTALPAVVDVLPAVVDVLPAVVDVLPEVLPTVAGALPEVVGRVPTLVAVVPGMAEAVPAVMSVVPDGRIGSAAFPSTGRTGQPVRVVSLAGPPSLQPAQPSSVLAAIAVPAVIPPAGPVDPPAPRDDRIFEIGTAGATSRYVSRVADFAPPFGPSPPFGPNSPFRTGPAGQQATPVPVSSGQAVTVPAGVGWQSPSRFPLTFSHGDVIRAGRWPGVPALPG